MEGQALDELRCIIDDMPHNKRHAVYSLTEHIIKLCDAYGDTGASSLAIIAALVADDVQSNKLD